jgi:hypothetical protein
MRRKRYTLSDEELITVYITNAMNGLTVKEIAELTDMTENQIDSRLKALRNRGVNVPLISDIKQRKDSKLNALIKKLTK